MKPNISTANDLTRGQESAVLIKIAEQLDIEDIQKAIETFLRGSVKVVWVKLIDMIGTTKTSATTEKFVAKEKFLKDSKEVKFYGIWGNFTKWFLPGEGKIEGSLGEQELRYGNLVKNSVDGQIITELGGKEKAETSLIELYDLLKRQANGGEGVLLTNGYANIFYIRDESGILRAVSVHGAGVGWNVRAYSVVSLRGWGAGNRVFSRNS